MKKYHKSLAAMIIIMVLCALVISSHLAGLMDYAEFTFYDLKINLLAGSRPRSQDITLVLLTQDCLEWGQRERGWPWPWPREAYAEFTEFMNLGGASSVAFDVLFTEPSIYDIARQEERDDALFAQAARNFGRAVQVVYFSRQWGAVNTWPADLNAPLFDTEIFGSDISLFDLSGDFAAGAQFPIRQLRNAAAVIGNVTGQPDSDNTYRRLRLFTVFDNKAVPGLSAAALLAAGYDAELSYDQDRRLIRWGEYSIPIDADGKTSLRFRGPLSRYPVYNMSDVLQSAANLAAGREPVVWPEDFAGSYVFFGFNAPGLFDICNTPIDANYPGIGMHVTMLDNMLMGDFIQKAPDWIAMLIIAAAVILIVLLVTYCSRITITVAGLLTTLIAFSIAAFWAFHAGHWIPIAAPGIAALLAYLSATLYNYATEGKDKRFIKHAFSRILSPKVIDQIIADPAQLKLGGEMRKMTAMFTDIQRFSTISSELQDQYGEDGPRVLVDLLNLYLTEMSNIVLENGGTIDKYEGDAIIAFFGAPVWMEDHAKRACRSAVQMKKREMELVQTIMDPETKFYNPLKKLIESRAVPADRPLFTRLGINTGDMVVGFMGTPSKMDYTIMGNAVNLAARLEGVNKQYNTRGILISEYTREFLGDEFVMRSLSRVTVVGIPVPLRLYELLDLRKGASVETLRAVGLWEEAFAAYESRNFAGAKKILAGLCEKDPGDKMAKLYLERCEKFAAAPPADWDGVDNLTEK